VTDPITSAVEITTADESTASVEEDQFELKYRTAQGLLRITIDGAEPPWLRSTARALASLLNLKPGWNSYAAPQIDRAAVIKALQLLDQTMPDLAPPPSVVPSSRGGVQLEWHTHGIELEVLILSSGEFSVYFENLHTNDITETEFVSDASTMGNALGMLAQRAA
jgi:hypothetical protein